ncbi:uncharacterized protein CLUP02_09327 [Colletotrichum lupini]|uniref:Major facilitator superfamily (MFS) profile domain-containing protein n=1 Tax=Colletotrichum lupini TaxID=145971 RepID=A0A9Q8SW24_9PEZI|nr:uncharacterized protein CLUP02_09327 [Colletotrichum lupini]UQC83831.1 hypothetical protein CLUP02_09327 [Colletotrichum lupini]
MIHRNQAWQSFHQESSITKTIQWLVINLMWKCPTRYTTGFQSTASTSLLPSFPVAAEYKTSGDIISLSNALYLVFMAISPCFWGPLSQVYGRKWASSFSTDTTSHSATSSLSTSRRLFIKTCMVTASLFLGCSIGTALSPNVPAFFVFRILTAFAGTSFLVTGPAVIGDLYHPTERATAMGWFLSGTLIGPTIGPVLGGIIVTYTSWRAIFWLQTALAGVGVGGAILFMPETLQELKKAGLEGLAFSKKVRVLWGMTNPVRVVRLFKFPNLILVAIASGSLVWNMYGMLTPIRYVLNPRFSLTSPAQSGLFYLAPGCGYLAGTLVGGRYADYTVRRWIAERHGRRISEDRLRSCLPFLGAVLPGCMLIYGWTVQQRVGGIAVPVVFMFLGGVSQLFCFPSLNTYCLDVIQGRSAEVIAGNFMVRYLFGAAGSAVVLPAIKVIGVGWFSTISAGFLVVGALSVWAVALWGRRWVREGDLIQLMTDVTKVHERRDIRILCFKSLPDAAPDKHSTDFRPNPTIPKLETSYHFNTSVYNYAWMEPTKIIMSPSSKVSIFATYLSEGEHSEDMMANRIKVAIAGATGNTGSSIVNALLKSPELFDVTALARPSSIKKPELLEFAKRGVHVKAIELDGPTEAISGVLTNMDVVISCLTLFTFQEKMNLIEASSKVNVGRYIPSFWGPVCAPRGVMMLRDKEFVDRIWDLHLPYTIIDVGWWYQLTLPALPSGRFRPMVEEYCTTRVIGDGNTPWALTNNRDIGNFVSRIIADPRTLNKMVFAYGEVKTQNEAFDILEKVSGETMTKEELEGIISQGRTGQDIMTINPEIGMGEYRNLLGIRGENTPDFENYVRGILQTV